MVISYIWLLIWYIYCVGYVEIDESIFQSNRSEPQAYVSFQSYCYQRSSSFNLLECINNSTYYGVSYQHTCTSHGMLCCPNGKYIQSMHSDLEVVWNQPDLHVNLLVQPLMTITYPIYRHSNVFLSSRGLHYTSSSNTPGFCTDTNNHFHTPSNNSSSSWARRWARKLVVVNSKLIWFSMLYSGIQWSRFFTLLWNCCHFSHTSNCK